ncbi:MAG: hypothetical protein RL660_2281 [Bacteroidota bacterium]|jgi:hypothetical protein
MCQKKGDSARYKNYIKVGMYLTLHINITFKESTPNCVRDFFTKRTKHEDLPTFLYEMDLNFENKINLTTPDMLLTEYGAKTYTDDKPNIRLRLQFTQEFELDALAPSIYPFITFVVAFAEDDFMAGYIKSELEDYDAFAIKDGIVYWQQDQQIAIDADKKLDYFELVALGCKIRLCQTENEELAKFKAIFDNNTNITKASELLADTSKSVEQVVELCLS